MPRASGRARRQYFGVVEFIRELRLHTETACRRGGALGVHLEDLDTDRCLVNSVVAPCPPRRRPGHVSAMVRNTGDEVVQVYIVVCDGR